MENESESREQSQHKEDHKGQQENPRQSRATKEAKSVALHAVLGAVTGWLSFYVDRVLGFGILSGIALLIVLLYVSHLASKKIFHEKDAKWWIGNGAIVFILMWLVVGSLLTTL